MEARIPFSGFYESRWSAGLDEEEEQYLEALAEEHDVKKDDLQSFAMRYAEYRNGYEHIAKSFVPQFEQFINDGLGLEISLGFDRMTSPKYYNFKTDHIMVNISYRDALILARRVGRSALRAAAKRLFTSRDGFISFYSNDVSTWGRLRDWDAVQIYALFEAAVDAIGDENYEWSIYETMSANGVFCDAYSACLSHSDLMLEVGRLVGRKEVLEEAEAEDDGDGRSFPAIWKDTADYVQRYESMNANIYQTLTKSEGL